MDQNIKLQKVSISKVIIKDKNKDGVALKTKDGKSFRKVVIQTNELGDLWLSKLVFDYNDPCLSFKEGDVVDIVIEKNGDFYNFKLPSRLDRLEARVKALEDFMINNNLKDNTRPNKPFEKAISDKETKRYEKIVNTSKTPEIDLDDIPDEIEPEENEGFDDEIPEEENLENKNIPF